MLLISKLLYDCLTSITKFFLIECYISCLISTTSFASQCLETRHPYMFEAPDDKMFSVVSLSMSKEMATEKSQRHAATLCFSSRIIFSLLLSAATSLCGCNSHSTTSSVQTPARWCEEHTEFYSARGKESHQQS